MPLGLGQYLSHGNGKQFQIPSADHADEAHEDAVYAMDLRGSFLVTASRDKTIRIWNVDTQRLVRPPLRSHGASVVCVQSDDRPEQDVIISGDADGSFVIWQFSTGEILKKAEMAHQETVLSLCFDDRHLVTSGRDRTIKVWNRLEMQRGGQPLAPYSEVRTITGHAAAVNVVKVHGDTIVSGGSDRTISIWNIHTGEKLRTITVHAMGIATLQYSGRFIVSGSSDRTIRIFDLERPEDHAQIAVLEGHSDVVRRLQLKTSVSGTALERIVSGGYDEVVKVWQHDDSSTWTTTLNLGLPANPTGEKNRVFDVQFDERRLFCASASGTITGWDFTPGDSNADLQQLSAMS